MKIGSLKLKNPILTASGTFGYGLEYASVVDLNRLGGIVVKGLSLEPRIGNKPPRICETPAGMLNAIGLQNVGVKAFLSQKLPALRNFDVAVVVNVLGDSLDEYVRLSAELSRAEGISALELNVSCPNVKEGGLTFGLDPAAVERLTRTVTAETDLPVWVKLTPNLTSPVEAALAAQAGGAEAVSLINTLLGMAVNPVDRRPRLSTITGGLSGPAVKPVAVRMVWQAAQAIDIPVVGMGGISSGLDAAEFMLAGATAVQVGTANFVNPAAAERIGDELADYCRDQGLSGPTELIGAMITP